LEGQLLDRGDLELVLAAGGAVGLGEDEGDFVAGVDEGLEAGNGEFGGSAEDEFHGLRAVLDRSRYYVR
jgi:hypothetical protein